MTRVGFATQDQEAKSLSVKEGPSTYENLAYDYSSIQHQWEK